MEAVRITNTVLRPFPAEFIYKECSDNVKVSKVYTVKLVNIRTTLERIAMNWNRTKGHKKSLNIPKG
jgi:hypothetical protein